MSGNCLNGAVARVHPEGVLRPFAFEDAAIAAQMAKEGVSFHATKTVS